MFGTIIFDFLPEKAFLTREGRRSKHIPKAGGKMPPALFSSKWFSLSPWALGFY